MATQPSRPTSGSYVDPLDVIWGALAEELGLKIQRNDDAYASFDGARTLTICTEAAFDQDDCLAQMILHELCHALVGGERARRSPDWGLESDGDGTLDQEHAAHRLQAHLTARHGLRDVLAVTTTWRDHYDAMGAEPLKEDCASAELARQALSNARAWGWEPKIDQALKATAALAEIIRPYAKTPSLWQSSRPLHHVGFALGDQGVCGACAWGVLAGPGPKRLRCLQTHDGSGRPLKRVSPEDVACDRFEARLSAADCPQCAACCKEGFDAVPLGRGEPLLLSRPDLVESRGRFKMIPRPQGHCMALKAQEGKGFLCTVYDLRPRSCRDLGVASIGCLQARRRTGLSRG